MVASVQASAERVKAAIRQYGDRVVNYALPTALTRTAMDARAELLRQMPIIFDRPTPYTLNSTYVAGATRYSPSAAVGFRDFYNWGTPAARYLRPNVEGGGRRMKRAEVQLRNANLLPPGHFAVPGEEAEVDAYGNMRRAQIVKILSAVRAFSEQGYNANRSRTARSRGKRRNETYFVAAPDNRGNLPPGIYRRDNADARPVIIFVKAPRYRARFPFYGIIEHTVRIRFPIRFAEALGQIERRFSGGSR